jgi:hypothetical protein
MNMKLLTMLFVVSSSAFASDVVITRFNPVAGRLAELCGVVTPVVPKAETVRAIVDYNTSAASSYTINVDANGNFCSVVTSYYGRVLVVSGEFQTFANLK